MRTHLILKSIILPGLLMAGCVEPLAPDVDDMEWASQEELDEMERIAGPSSASQIEQDAMWMDAQLTDLGTRSMELDLTDDRHLSVLLHRLQHNGLTAESAPHIYALIAAVRRGELVPSSNSEKTTATTPPCNFYFTQKVTSKTSSSTTMTADATTGCYQGAQYVYKDHTAYKKSTSGTLTALGSKYGEFYGAQAKDASPIELSGSIPSNYSMLQVSTAIIVANDGSYKSEYSQEAADPICAVTPTAPIDLNSDKVTNICYGQQRDWCDYNYASATNGKMLAPFSGQYTYVIPGYLSKVKGLSYFEATAHVKSSGGVCGDTYAGIPPVSPLSSTVLEVKRFDNTYGDYCGGASNQVYLDINMTGYGQYDANKDGIINGSDPTRYCTPPVSTATNAVSWVEGCVAAGTMVLLGDGQEEVLIDQLVMNGSDQPARIVAQDSLGALGIMTATLSGQDTLLYELTDELGHRVAVTHTHPVMTALGPVPAELLRKGDLIETVDGPAELVQVTALEGDVEVFNLLIDDYGPRALGRGYGTFIANGIVVGDQRLQGQVEAILADNSPATVPDPDWAGIIKSLRRR